MGQTIELSDENYDLLQKVKKVYELKSMDEAFQLIAVWANAKKRSENKREA